MAGNGLNGDRARLLLVVPFGIVLLVSFAAALARALVTGDVQPLVIVSVPFGSFVGYVIGIRIVRPPR